MGGGIQTFIKTCTVCKQGKPLEDFYSRKASKDGKAYRCKICDDLAVSSYRERNKEKHRNLQRQRNRKHKYGITEDQYKDLINLHDNKCAICKVQLQQNATNKHTPETLCIDHNHKTGKVRGLLCTLCNKALGLFKDDPELLEKAKEYLENAKIH